MQFGPLELQSCGENNFTMKALGLLAFRPDLLKRFIEKLDGPDAFSSSDEPMSILFFSRIGEGFFREAIERETELKSGKLEDCLNKTFGLPDGFRWRRNQNGQLTQPAKWQSKHIDDMLKDNNRENDRKLREQLDFIQDCLNTEPDIVLQWGRKLAFVEIKVLSGEGDRQMERQIRLGHYICKLLNWDDPLFFMIGSAAGNQPTATECRFFSWKDMAEWFSDTPEISDYIQSVAFFYNGYWQSMTANNAKSPGITAFDILKTATHHRSMESMDTPGTSDQVSPASTTTDPASDSWHFAHLGCSYFIDLFNECKKYRVWPLRWIWIGKKGVPYKEKKNGRKINPNWMIEDMEGKRYTRSKRFQSEHEYAEEHMRRFSYEEIARHFNLST